MTRRSFVENISCSTSVVLGAIGFCLLMFPGAAIGMVCGLVIGGVTAIVTWPMVSLYNSWRYRRYLTRQPKPRQTPYREVP